jgi:hypothetical protein
MKFTRRTAGYNEWDHKRNEDISDKLKIKNNDTLYSELPEEMVHVNRMNIGRIEKTNFKLPAKRTKINWMSSKGMGGKFETVTGHLA